MKDYQSKMARLLDKWQFERSEYEFFARDGVLNFDRYKLQNPKITFLLKEPNASFLNIAPLDHNKEGHGPNGNSNLFWRYMRGYEYIIKTAWNNSEFDEQEALRVKELPNNNTAYVNIKKKCDNKPLSNNNEIVRYAIRDKYLLREQIDLINPDIIFCAGTFSSFKVLYDDIEKLDSKVYRSNGKLIIDFYHLAHRKGYKTFKELYELLSRIEFKSLVNS